MHYYEVWVRSHRYQKREPLTYSSTSTLPIGSIIQVELQRQSVPAIVVAEVTQPSFTCKPILELHDIPPMPIACLKLFRWLQQYYPASIGTTTQLFLPAKIRTVSTEQQTGATLSQNSIKLNEAQQNAYDSIVSAGPGSSILHGRTGSGKTRVYAALARQTLQAGQSALILCPEISLTAQLVATFEELLGVKPLVLHSHLTPAEREKLWSQIANTEQPLLVLGARSALFSPLRTLGLIIIDEAHEPAYKQEQQPYYQATRVAAKLAEIHKARLVLGSATPLITDYFLAKERNRPVIRMGEIATTQRTVIETAIVDLKDRSAFTGKTPHLSAKLIESIRASLANGEQSMLYLNRRGTARMSLCSNCGWQALCPHCDIALTYHGDSHTLLCHTCGRKQESIITCPQCSSPDIVFRSAGTKAIFDEVGALFPEARIARFDTDNLKSERLETHYEAVRSGELDIIVGTQLLAKGLDLPRLATLGVILADSSLAIPDFTAQERTYQLLQQVVGRVGRGHTAHATTVIQTYNPGSETLQDAITDNWEAFYARELAERKAYNFPPFVHLLKLVCKRKTVAGSIKAAESLQKKLKAKFDNDILVEGPTPSFREKSNGYYHWQLIVKSKQRSVLLTVLDELPTSGWTYDIDPANLL